MLKRPFARYTIAAAAVALALGCRLAIQSALHAELPTYITFYPAVMLVALLAGQRAGLIATALSAFAATYFVIPPIGQFAIEKPADAVGLALFCLMGVFMSVVAKRYRRSQERVAVAEKELALQNGRAALAERELQYRTLFTNMSEGFCVIEVIFDAGNKPVDYRFLEVNASFEQQTGLHEAQGKLMRDLAPAHEAHWFEIYGKVALTGEPAHFENEARALDRWYDVHAYHIGEPKMRRVGIIFNDISLHKRAEEALRRQANLLRISFDAIAVWRLDGGIESWNIGAEHLYGFSESEALGRVTHELLRTVHPAPWPQLEAELLEKRFWEGELHHFTKDGREVIVSARKQLIRGADGVERVLETNRDITEHKQAEEELQQAKRHAEDVAVQLRSVVENMAERLYVCDSKGHPILTNAAFRATYLGTDAPEYPRTFAEHWDAFDMAGDSVPVEDWPIGLALRGQKVRGAEFRTRSKFTGKDMISSYNASPVFDSQGKVTMALFTSQDITERKRAEEAFLEVHERLRLFIEYAPVSLAMFDRDMRYLHVSRHWLNSYNLGNRDVYGVSHYKVFPEISEEWKQNHRRGLAGEVLHSEGDRFERADGSVQWVRWEIRPWQDAAGAVGGIVIFSEDITASKLAEKALQESEQRERERAEEMAVMLEAVPMPVFIARDPDCLYLTGNRLGEEILRIPRGNELSLSAPAEIRPRHFRTLKDGRELRLDELPAQRSARGAHVKEFEFTLAFDDGMLRHVLGYGTPLLDNQGHPRGSVATLVDITERKRTEEQLQKLNRTLKALNNSNQALLHATDEPALLQQVCRIVSEDCGHAMVWIGFAENDENKTVRPVAYSGFEEGYLETMRLTWADSERGRGPTGAAIRTGQPSMCRNMLTDPAFLPWRAEAVKRGYACSLVLPLKESDEVFGAITIYSREPDTFSEGEVNLLTELAADLAYGIGALRARAARAQAERALRQSEERWATTLRSIGDAVISTCAQGKVIFMNDVAQTLTGWTLADAQGKDLETVFNIVNEVTRIKPENPVSRVIRHGQVVGLANHTALLSRDGTEYPIEDSAAPIRNKDGEITGVVLVFHDVLEKRKVEKALQNSERLATTGRLAATLAHEIHNPLDTVGNLLYLMNQAPQPEEAREYVALAAQEVARVTQMTRHMLAFQRESNKPVPVNIAEILDSVVVLFERKIQSAGIQVEKHVQFEQEFLGLPGEMRQVFANLFGNAVEAVGKNGKIRLIASAAHNWRTGQLGLRVVVADNGPGIPANIRGKIFDPFFTTKGEAGTGLGLWITSGIVHNSGGTLSLRSVTRDGRTGTCFSVFLPIK